MHLISSYGTGLRALSYGTGTIMAGAAGHGVVAAILIALLVAVIVGVVFYLLAPTRPYAGPVAVLVLVVLLLLLLL